MSVCESVKSWNRVHCGHECPFPHLPPRRERNRSVCVRVCVWCVIQTDSHSWPTAPESRFFSECVDTDHLLTALHALWILCSCGTGATTGRKKMRVGTFYPPGQDAIFAKLWLWAIVAEPQICSYICWQCVPLKWRKAVFSDSWRASGASPPATSASVM